MSNHDLAKIRQRWTRQLSGLRRRLRWHQTAEAAAVLVAGVVVAGVLTGWIDYRFELSGGVRRGVLLIGFLTLGWFAWQRLLRPLLTKLDLLDVAALVDRATLENDGGTSHAGAVVSHGQSVHVVETRHGTVVASVARVFETSDDASPLVRKAVADSDARLAAVPMGESLCGSHLVKNLVGSAAAIVVPVVLAIMLPTVSKVWASRWLGGEDVGYPRNTSIEIVGLENGVLRVPRGEPARVAVAVSDQATSTEIVWLRLDPPDSQRLTSTLDRYGDADSTTNRLQGDFRGDLPPLSDETPASVWGGDARPVRFTVTPVDRPQVVGLDLIAKHPQEPTARSFDLTTATDVRLLKDTVTTLTLRSSVPVEPSLETNADVTVEPLDDRTYAITWTQTEPTSIRVALTSTESGLESFPRTVPIGLLPDRPPSVTLRHSGVRLRVTPVATIPLAVTARDDFAVAETTIAGEIARLVLDEEQKAESEKQEEGGDGAKRPAAPQVAPPTTTGVITLYKADGEPTERRIDREHRLELAPLVLKPGDVVKVAAKASDAAYGGSQERTSRTITFRVVKTEDLFREVLLRLQQLRSRLRKATDSAEALRIDMQTAELPKTAATLGRRHQVIRREVGAITQQIAQAVDEMTLNKLGGDESQELISRNVIRPLERVLAGTMDRQRVSLGELARSTSAEVESNRQEAVRRQQEIVASLTEVLSNMNQWDSFVDVVNQLNAVIGLEEKVRSQTDALRDGQPGDTNSAKEDDPDTDAASDIFD